MSGEQNMKYWPWKPTSNTWTKSLKKSQHIDCSILFAEFNMSTCYFCWSGLYRSFVGIFVYGPLHSFVVNSEFTQLDGRKKRRAKGFCLTPWIPDSRSVLDYSLCQWNLDSWFHSVARFCCELWFGFWPKATISGISESGTLYDDIAIEHSRKWTTNWKPWRLKDSNCTRLER